MSTNELVNVLQALMSANNVQRKAAEEHYNQLLALDNQSVLQQLLTVFDNHHENPVVRLFAAVLLRRGIEQSLTHWAPSSIEGFKTQVLHAWQRELNAKLSQKMAHVIGQVSLKADWENLIAQVVAYARGHDQQHQAMVIQNASQLLEILADYAPQDITSQYQLIGEFLSPFLGSENSAVRIASAKTIAAVIASIEEDSARNAFKPVVGALLSVLHATLSQGDESDAVLLMDHLVSVAQLQPMFFKGSFDALSSAMLQVGHAESLEFSTRTMALEVLLTISESAPAMARRASGFIEKLSDLVLLLMLSVDEDEVDWQRQRYSLEDADDEDCTAGDEAMERMAAGLGGKSVTEIVLTRVQSLSQQSHWKYRRAALSAICRVGEGASKHFVKYLNSVLPFLLSSLSDTSTRVQYEAIQTIGRFAAVFADQSDEFVQMFLPPLGSILQNTSNCPRIRGHAASALINLLNPVQCDAETLLPFTKPLLEALLLALQEAPFEVRSPCLVSVGCVAQICPNEFSSFYEQFMPGIKSLLTQATAPELADLRGKAIECAGLIGEAVGTTTFAKDALEIMHIFVHAMHADTEKDITFEYILPACARIAKALRGQFLEFIPIVCEPLLAGARLEVNFSMVDADDDEVEGEITHDEETGIQSTVVSFGAGMKKRVSLNTTAVQQRTQAARIIFELASALGLLLGGYLVPFTTLLLEMIVDRHSNDLRATAATALHSVFAAMVLQVCQSSDADRAVKQSELQPIFESIVDKLVQAMKIEPDASARAAQAESLRDILSAVYLSGNELETGTRIAPFVVQLSEQMAYNITACTLLQCAECVLRRNQKEEELAKHEGLDEEDQQAQMEELEVDNDQLVVLIDLFGHLLKLRRHEFMPLFDRLVAPSFSSYLDPSQPVFLQTLATSLIADAIEFGGDDANKYLQGIAPVLFANTQREDDDTLRQCSLYALAVATQTSPSVMQSLVAPLLGCFVSTVLHPDAMDEDHLGMTENSIFGIGNLLAMPVYREAILQQSASFPLMDLSKLWLSKLPLNLDEMESKSTLKNLVDMIECRDVALFPEGNGVDAASPFRLDILRVMAEGCRSLHAHQQSQRLQPQFLLQSDDAEVVTAHSITVQRIRAQLLHSPQSSTWRAFVAKLPIALQQSIADLCL